MRGAWYAPTVLLTAPAFAAELGEPEIDLSPPREAVGIHFRLSGRMPLFGDDPMLDASVMPAAGVSVAGPRYRLDVGTILDRFPSLNVAYCGRVVPTDKLERTWLGVGVDLSAQPRTNENGELVALLAAGASVNFEAGWLGVRLVLGVEDGITEPGGLPGGPFPYAELGVVIRTELFRPRWR